METNKRCDATRVIALEGVLNMRELGGLLLKNGRQVRPGRLIRSGRLSDLTKTGRQILQNHWNVTEIVDLRNDQEAAQHPDPALEGAVLRRLSIFPDIAAGISRNDLKKSPVDTAIQRAKSLGPHGAKQLLTQMYPDMVSKKYCLDRLRDFFRLLLFHEEGAFLWHCTSGKDRTGLSCALLLWVLGASWDIILEDYLFTNQQTQSYRDALCADMRRHGAQPQLVEQIRILESVDTAYLETCFSTISRDYGSVEAFMEQRLGVTAAIRKRLQEKYTRTGAP